MVAPIEADYMRALYEVRAALERGRAAVATGDKAALADADLAFHGVVNELAGNPAITEIAREQWSHIRRAIDVVLDDPGVHARVWDEHAEILSAMRPAMPPAPSVWPASTRYGPGSRPGNA